jgi:hypothetical protein
LGVSCPASDTCEAVGYYEYQLGGAYHTLAEGLNGTRWSAQKVRGTKSSEGAVGGLNGVSCPTIKNCVAVGNGVTESWNGESWSIRSRHVGELDAVSCWARRSCTAVGSEIDRWNGKRWRLQSGVGGYSALAGVSCPSSRSCTAVGWDSPDHDDSVAMAAQWTGMRWSFTDNILVGHDAYDDGLGGVSCVTKTACIAVGVAESPPNPAPIAAEWNGTDWTDISP